MSLRKLLMIVVTILLTGAVLVSVVNALEVGEQATIANLENVRDYAPALTADGIHYAVDGGELFGGAPGAWQRIPTPNGVLVNTVANSRQDANLLYIGAANELAIYRSTDAGKNWTKIPLDTNALGGVTDIAVDAANRLIYVGTDTDGLHRLRDVGTSMIAGGHLLLDEPVVEVVAESSSVGMAFVRTKWNLYRAEDMGLRWVAVENLPSPATAVIIAETTPPTAFVGTASNGVRMSQDGVEWQSVNNGLRFAPGSQLYISALAVDAVQPEVLYVSASLSLGSAVLYTTPLGVSMSTDGARIWEDLATVDNVAVTELMPVTGRTGAVYALTEASRTPVALGDAPVIEMAATQAPVAAATGIDFLSILAWVLAGLAAVGFAIILWLDVSRRRRQTRTTEQGVLVVEPIRRKR
ncbi:MAG: hypothetical protein KF893_25145 [Caldilineaceae bacterium]|nr:hypothetical protein [Caldilineaceae bacterium]